MRPDEDNSNIGLTASVFVMAGKFGWKGSTEPELCPKGH